MSQHLAPSLPTSSMSLNKLYTTARPAMLSGRAGKREGLLAAMFVRCRPVARQISHFIRQKMIYASQQWNRPIRWWEVCPALHYTTLHYTTLHYTVEVPSSPSSPPGHRDRRGGVRHGGPERGQETWDSRRARDQGHLGVQALLQKARGLIAGRFAYSQAEAG